jgi:hypothetical protein
VVATAVVLFLPNHPSSHAFHNNIIATAAKRLRAQCPSPSCLFQQQYYDDNQYCAEGGGGGQQIQNEGDANYYYDDQQGQQYQQQQPSEYYVPQADPQQQQQQQQQYYQQHQQQQYQSVDDYPSVDQEQPSLLITGNMQEEMKRATSNVDVPLDYLALARQRAAERRESINSLSTDGDWLDLAESKKRAMGGDAAFAEDDDWVTSLKDEGGSNDIAALGMRVEGGVMVTEGGIVVDIGGAEGDDGPKLLW